MLSSLTVPFSFTSPEPAMFTMAVPQSFMSTSISPEPAICMFVMSTLTSSASILPEPATDSDVSVASMHPRSMSPEPDMSAFRVLALMPSMSIHPEPDMRALKNSAVIWSFVLNSPLPDNPTPSIFGPRMNIFMPWLRLFITIRPPFGFSFLNPMYSTPSFVSMSRRSICRLLETTFTSVVSETL